MIHFFILLSSLFLSCKDAKEVFVLASPNETAQIIISDNESEVVHIAAEMFAEDIYEISGKRLATVGDSNPKYTVEVGTLGKDEAFDLKCNNAGIDTDQLKDKWEAYIIKVVSDGQGKTLFIVGSNARGTAYGIMEVSRMIGISPWTWWADVRPTKRKSVSLPGDLYIEDAPKVKYRGIFLNDEDWGLQPWAAKTFEPETGDIGPKTYGKIFELLLRHKANAIWPAMHDCTQAFYTIPGNQEMAAKYQIFIGTSHAEPMLRNNVSEWDHDQYGEYNYSTNDKVVLDYWKNRIKELTLSDKYLVTLGMRGIHDSGMRGNLTTQQRVGMLESIISDQRDVLKTELNKDLSDIPQAFVPYKEVLKIYKDGAQIPEDVTLIWPDDNHGYIRQLSNAKERLRPGGAGVYYHISYWGRPHDFLWLESIPASLIWEEMNKAYHTNARNIWVANVGDIKSNEIGMNFFLDMAWDPKQFAPETLNTYYEEFARDQFGEENAKEIGKLLQQYFQLGFSRKPEHMGYNKVYPNGEVSDPALSLFHHGDEVAKRINAYENLEKMMERLMQNMPEHLQDAFYQLVAYKVIGAANMNKKILYAYKSRTYAQQGRNSANLYAQKATKAFEKIKQATEKYNETIANGKWKNMMNYNPRELPVFAMPPTGSYNPNQEKAGGLFVEGYPQLEDNGQAELPVFNSFANSSHFIDIYNSGKQSLVWSIASIPEWIKISKMSGETSMDERIWISVDWDAVATFDTVRSEILIKINDKNLPVIVKAVKMDINNDQYPNLAMEDNGIISIDAGSYDNMNSNADRYWQKIQGLGKTGDAVSSFPLTTESIPINDLSDSPKLNYDFYSNSTGEFTAYFHCLPVHPINEEYKLRFAASIDNGPSVIINGGLKEEMDEHYAEWQNNVLQATSIHSTQLQVNTKGKHILTIRMIDPGVVLDKIEIVHRDIDRGR